MWFDTPQQALFEPVGRTKKTYRLPGQSALQEGIVSRYKLKDHCLDRWRRLLNLALRLPLSSYYQLRPRLADCSALAMEYSALGME